MAGQRFFLVNKETGDIFFHHYSDAELQRELDFAIEVEDYHYAAAIKKEQEKRVASTDYRKKAMEELLAISPSYLRGLSPYTISKQKGGLSITCNICGLTSYNTNDIENKYCSNCKKFHI